MGKDSKFDACVQHCGDSLVDSDASDAGSESLKVKLGKVPSNIVCIVLVATRLANAKNVDVSISGSNKTQKLANPLAKMSGTPSSDFVFVCALVRKIGINWIFKPMAEGVGSGYAHTAEMLRGNHPNVVNVIKELVA